MSSLRDELPRKGDYIPRSIAGMFSEYWEKGGKRQLNKYFSGMPSKVSFIDHHLAHAVIVRTAFRGTMTPIVIVADGRGAWQATSIYHGQAGRLKLVRAMPYPNSIGLLYKSFTDLLGFERHNDEWKVMGLAAYGEPTFPMDAHIEISEYDYQVKPHTLMGRYWSDLSPLTARYGPRRNPEKSISDDDRNLAASVQKATEDAMFAVLRDALRHIPSKNLCLAGGVAMNSKANGKLLASGMVDSVFIQPAATDDGTAIGAALAAYHKLTGKMPRYHMTSAYLGPGYTQEQIEQTLKVYKIPFRRSDNITKEAAKLIADGNISWLVPGANGVRTSCPGQSLYPGRCPRP